MSNYPIPPNPQRVYTSGITFKTIVSQAENGTEQRRAKWSQGKRVFTLVYNVLHAADMATLWNFYVSQQGSYGGFTFTDPDDQSPTYGQSFNVRFSNDDLTYEAFEHYLRAFRQIQLIQVIPSSAILPQGS